MVLECVGLICVHGSSTNHDFSFPSICQLGKQKGMSKVKDWSNHIVRHFWHCASECRKDDSTPDAEALRRIKVY